MTSSYDGWARGGGGDEIIHITQKTRMRCERVNQLTKFVCIVVVSLGCFSEMMNKNIVKMRTSSRGRVSRENERKAFQAASQALKLARPHMASPKSSQ